MAQPQSALRALDQAYMMGIGQGPAPARVPRTRGQTAADMLGAASLPMSAVPIAGDITGLAADAAMYAAYPEERTLGNYAMSALGGLPLIPGAAALRAARSDPIDMSTEARMQRAAEQGYTDRLRHSSSEVFAGSPQAEETMGYDIPIQTEFKKTHGGTYFAPAGSAAEDIFTRNNPFGGSAEYLLKKGNNFDANYKNMSEAQKKELTEIIGSVVDADEIDNAFDVFTDGDFYQTYGRKAQDNLMNAFSKRGYDSVTFPDNLAMGDMTQSTVVFKPSNIRSVNAAFDPANRRSANILATAAGGTISLSALRQLMPQEEERPIE